MPAVLAAALNLTSLPLYMPPQEHADVNMDSPGPAAFLEENAMLIAIGAICVIAVIAACFVIGSRRRRSSFTEIAVANPSDAGGVIAVNIQGAGARESQQDSLGITDVTDTSRGVFAVIADGMGGMADGAEISRIVTSQMLHMFQSSHPGPDADIAAMLLYMVHDAQDRAREFIEQNGGEQGGSTVVSAIVKDGGLYFMSVGDSRICLLRSGALIQLNREHTFASELNERAVRGEITLAEARNDPHRGSLTSYIGMDDKLEVDGNMRPIPIIVGDRIVLMSDGVFGTLSDAELTQLAGVENVFEAGFAIEQAIISKQKPDQDNFSAILLAF